MGYLIATDFIDEGDTLFGNPNSTIFTAAKKLKWLNEAYINDVAACFPIPEITQSISTTIQASVGYYAIDLTAYIRVNNVVKKEDSFVMIPMSQEDFARLGGQLATPVQGSPDRWYLEWNATAAGVVIVPYPAPAVDTDVIIHVNRRPVTLTSGDATTLQAIWDEPIKAFFMSRYAQMLRNYDDARYWRDYAQNTVARLAPFDVYGSKMMRTLPAPVGFGNMGGQVHEA
jgi:hypothetical protein